MDLVTVVLIAIGLLVFLLMMSVPLPYCFGGALMFMGLFGNVSVKSLFVWSFGQLVNTTLLASPLFILAGTLMGGSGIAKALLDFVDIFIARIKGGLGVVSVVTCAVIGAISGSGFTGVAATGPIMIPRMIEQGYPRGFATALVTCSSILGLLIPPSVVMIMYGWVTETSILACFLSTLLPGIIVTILFSVINVIWARKFDLVMESEESIRQKRKEVLPRFKGAFPALMMPVIILGGIYGGIFTPTEAAAVAAIYSIPIGFWVYKGLKMGNFYELLKESATSVGSIMTMIMFCLMLSQTLVLLKVPQMVVELLMGITTNKFYLLLLINVVLFIAGMIVNDITGVILLGPLLLPLVLELGVSPVHFGAIMGVNLSMGGVTPPYASILYLGMRIGKCPFSEILHPTMVLLLFGYFPVILLTTYWAPLSTWLPTLLGY